MSDLYDNVVLIADGGSGLSLALAERFTEEGTQVAALELPPAKVASLRQCLGEHMLTVEGNVTCYVDYQRAVDQILTHYGTLDCFIGNAGVWDHNASLVNTPADALKSGFHELFNVNVLGYLLGMKVCAPALVTSEGSIIFTLSDVSWYPGNGGPLYTANRHATTGLIRQLAYELAPEIRTNGVGPCGMTTDLRDPQALGQNDTSITQPLTPEKIAAILPLQFFPGSAGSTDPYVMLAPKHNNRTLSGVMISVDAGLGIRGIRHIAAGLDLWGGVMNPETIAIVGGSQATAMATAALCQQGSGDELHLFSDEQHLPYERPPLSRATLLDDSSQLQPILPADW